MTAFVWDAKLVAEALGLPAPAWEHRYTGIATDTRGLKPGELFVALKGERYDAHDFLGDARMAEVGGVVVRPGTPRWPGFDWFEVPDTLAALGALAALRRAKFPGKVVAITGSTGKTSTRELIAAALGARFQVHESPKNLNNLVGVPLTVLAAPLEAGAMVVECGASVKGEIARMRAIVKPDIAVVTNVGPAHVEGFGSLEGVMSEKLELLRDAKLAVVGGDPPELADRAGKLAAKVIAPARAETVRVRSDGRACVNVRGVEIVLPVPGRHMVDNALIALAVAEAAGVDPAAAAKALERAVIPGGRSEVMEIDGVTLINDSYNANPVSLKAALGLLHDLRGTRRAVVVVGTMRELGAESSRLHQEAAQAVAEAKPDVIAAVGEFGPAFASLGQLGVHGAKLLTAATAEEIARQLQGQIRPGDVVLLKASRGVALERVIPVLWPNSGAKPAEVH